MPSKIKRRKKKAKIETLWTPFIRGFLPEKEMRAMKYDVVYLNSRYQVGVRRFPWPALVEQKTGKPVFMAHLSIKRFDKKVLHDWRDLQRIKNELIGEDAEAVELYPSESRLVDTSNEYHLWCIPPTYRFPLGFFNRAVSESESMGNVQRPFDDDVKPKDLISDEQMDKSVSALREAVKEKNARLVWICDSCDIVIPAKEEKIAGDFEDCGQCGEGIVTVVVTYDATDVIEAMMQKDEQS